MDWILFAAFILGLLFGSFLNVCIYRLPLRLSVSSPARSYCPTCKRTLTALENIPVLSWVIQLGRCRGCKGKISGQYPLVELLGGFAGVASVLRFGVTPTAGVIFFLLLSLIVVTFIDFEHKLIPDRITKPGMIIGCGLGILSQYTELFRCTAGAAVCPVTQGAMDSLLGWLIGAGFFQVMYWGYYMATKKHGLGGGDIKLLGMTGAIMGVKSVAPTIFLGSIFGAVVGVIFMVISGKGRETEIPFGPWLVLGAVVYLFGEITIFNIF